MKHWRYFDFMADMGEWFLSWPHPKDFVRKPIKTWGWYEDKFQPGDRVKLNGNPFDEQIPEELLIYTFLKDCTQTVTTVMHPHQEGTSGLWVKTNMIPTWTDAAWFDKETK